MKNQSKPKQKQQHQQNQPKSIYCCAQSTYNTISRIAIFHGIFIKIYFFIQIDYSDKIICSYINIDNKGNKMMENKKNEQ